MFKKFFRDHHIHKEIVPFLDLLMISSPVVFFVVWPLLSIGILIYFLSIDMVYVNIYSVGTKTVLLFVGSSLFVAGVSAINSINLRKEQGEDSNRYLAVNSRISISLSQNFSYTLLAIGFIILFYLSYKIVISMFILAVFLGVLYGHSNFKWRSKPINTLLCYIASAYSLILTGYLFGYIYLGEENISFLNSFFTSLPYQLAYILLSLSIIVVIVSNDKDGQNHFNKRHMIYLALILFILSFLIGMKFLDPLLSTLSLSCVPFILYACLRGMEKDFTRVITYSVLFLNLYIFTIHPFLFFPSLIVYYLSKYYYWHRFDLHYPSLIIGDDSDDPQ